MNMIADRLARIVRCSLLGAGISLAALSHSQAQEVSPEDRAKLRGMFEQIMREPSNLDLTFAYAQAATAAGDYEAAITAYERLLLYNPDLPRIKAELGVLYYRLGSYDVAKQYFEQALADGDPPAEMRARIETFLANIDQANKRHSFAGSFSFGLRYQTNANYGPDGQILVFDTPIEPDSNTEETDDFNVFTALTGRYVYDLGNDNGDFLSVRGSLYGSRQFEVTELDVEHLRLLAGPGFRLFPTESGPVLFEPHVRLTYTRLDDQNYNFTYGAGFDVVWQAFETTSLFTRIFYEEREYDATDELPNADTQDGGAFRFLVGATQNVSQDLFITGEAFAGHVYAADPSEAYDEIAGYVTIGHRIESPFARSETMAFASQPWNVSLTAGYAYRNYDAANLVVSTTRREDNEFRIDGSLAVPIGPSWNAFATLGYERNDSTLLNNDYDNVSASVGANLRF